MKTYLKYSLDVWSKTYPYKAPDEVQKESDELKKELYEYSNNNMNTSLKALTGDNDGNGISNVTDAFRKIYVSIVQQPVSIKNDGKYNFFFFETGC